MFEDDAMVVDKSKVVLEVVDMFEGYVADWRWTSLQNVHGLPSRVGD